MWTKVCGRSKPKTVTAINSESVNSLSTESIGKNWISRYTDLHFFYIDKDLLHTYIEVIVDIAPEPEKPYDGLNNTAFKELVGKSKMPIGNIKLIDINEEEILPDKDLWMTKSLTGIVICNNYMALSGSFIWNNYRSRNGS